MEKALVKISYRMVIDALAASAFEVNVLHASYNEFLLKSQAYNPGNKFKKFSEMVAADGRANSLHYKSGFAIDNFVAGLKNNMPDVFDLQGKNIKFSEYIFEVIESDITDKKFHKVAVNFSTEQLTLLSSTVGCLLFAYGNKSEELASKKIIENTFYIQLQQGLSIYQYQLI